VFAGRGQWGRRPIGGGEVLMGQLALSTGLASTGIAGMYKESTFQVRGFSFIEQIHECPEYYDI
jgi:hypothetical protein